MPSRAEVSARQHRALDWGRVALLLVAGLLMLRAAALLLGLPSQDLETEVATDGAEHTIAVTAREAMTLWTFDFTVEPICTITDGATSTPLRLDEPGEIRTRYAGTAGDWQTTARFVPVTDTVEVTCTGAAGVVLVTDEPVPLRDVVIRGLAALVLAIVGLFCLFGTATSTVRAARGD